MCTLSGLLGLMRRQELRGGTALSDKLGGFIYHAMVTSSLAYLASYRRPSSSRQDDLDERKRNLQNIVSRITPESISYDVRNLCYSSLAPTVFLRHEDTLYVASRGSTTAKDWVADLNFHLKSVDAGSSLPSPAQVHAGFLGAFKEQVETVLNFIDNEATAGLGRVIFCGHSLGGAVAQLLGLAYAHSKRNLGRRDFETTVVTFGCPRIGDMDLSDHLHERVAHWRLFVDEDPVAGVPSSTMKELWPSGDPVIYAHHAARESWCLEYKGCATRCGATVPEVKWEHLRVKAAHRHALGTYAMRLLQHRDACGTPGREEMRAATGSRQAPVGS